MERPHTQTMQIEPLSSVVPREAPWLSAEMGRSEEARHRIELGVEAIRLCRRSEPFAA